jgi:CheY-like chemotaxis protein
VARVSSQLVLARSERERAERLEQERLARRAAELDKQHLDEFLAMLSHELRNPLAPIMTALELMRLRGDGSFERERAIIERQAVQLVSLVDELMDVSRITRGKITLKQEPVDLADVVARAIEMVSPLLEQRRHTLSTSVPQQGLVVTGDAARLTQVVSNLLSNAAKYTAPEGRISVEAQHTGDAIVLTVRDNGSGIRADLLPRVFDLFAQQRHDSDRSQGGLGLGLSIVRSIVALHGGETSAHSEGPGRGSEFTVRLPALPVPPVLAQASAKAAVQRNRNAAARRVLVVDDNEDAARTLAAYLEGLGHTVRIANDGPGALRIAAQFAPDAVLLDIALPVMDGYEVARRLREQSGAERTCLIAVTGYGQRSDRARTDAAGFDTHLAKPVDLPSLTALLDRLEPVSGAS